MKNLLKENKKYVFIIILILIALICYKLISSKIQENKERNIINYRNQIEQLQKNSQNIKINTCIEDAETKAVADKEYIYILGECWGVGTLDNGSQEECIAKKGNGRKICSHQSDVCVARINEEIAKIEKVLSGNKEECYKRYK